MAAQLGFGAGPLGDAAMSDDGARALVDEALALGITFFDTARGYGESEARLGRLLPKTGVTVATKVGYGVDGFADWTGACVDAGIDRACALLQRDTIDVVFLHSCPRETLERTDVMRALNDAVRDGRVSRAGYSGDNDALYFAVMSGAFSIVEASVSLVDRANERTLMTAKERGLDVVAKRVLANASWRAGSDTRGADTAVLHERVRAMGFSDDDANAATFLRHVLFSPWVDVCLVGSSRKDAIREWRRAETFGALSVDESNAFAARYREVGHSWAAVV